MIYTNLHYATRLESEEVEEILNSVGISMEQWHDMSEGYEKVRKQCNIDDVAFWEALEYLYELRVWTENNPFYYVE